MNCIQIPRLLSNDELNQEVVVISADQFLLHRKKSLHGNALVYKMCSKHELNQLLVETLRAPKKTNRL